MKEFISFLFILKERLVSVIDWIETYSDFVIATATIAVAIFTGVLWCATRKLWKISLKQSKDMKTSLGIARNAANAAQKSADVADKALQISERAYLKIWNFRFSCIKVGEYLNVVYEIYNVGHTPAEIVNSITILDIIDNPVPTTPNYENKNITRGPIKTFIERDGEGSMPGAKIDVITDEDIKSIQNETKVVFCWGKITFRDVFNKTWIRGFGAVCSKNFGVAMMDGYNYTKEYEPEKEQS